jgi:choline dehydrogenase-like flavoprotein
VTRDERVLSALARVLLPEKHGLPGAEDAEVGARLAARIENFRPRVRAGARLMIRAWELSPLLSRRPRRFTRLTEPEQERWVHGAYRSRRTSRRLHIAALKQLVFIEWASSSPAEDALAYDYRCRRDDEVHGASHPITAPSLRSEMGPQPADYHRPGPATRSGAVPAARLAISAPTAPQRRGPLTTVMWPEVTNGARISVDAAVIGSGAGGAVVAARLAEAGLSVAVIEEGPPVESHSDFAGPMFDRFSRFCRDNATTQVWGSPPIPLPLGRVVGGTTVVNSGTCFRAPDHVLDRWRSEFGVEGADHASLGPYYAETEEFLSVRPVPWDLLGPNGAAAHKGATALGYSGGPLLRNIADCHGCGQCAFGCPTDAKQAMHISYLPRAVAAGATIYARCRADRVLEEGGRATGVAATLLGPDERSKGKVTFAARHVVVAAGAIHTPGLLSGSGIPDPAGCVGRNLRIHPATGVGGIFEAESQIWKGTLQSYYIDEFFSSHELMFEATHTVPSVGAGSIPGIGATAMEELSNFGSVATLGFYVSDTSRGRVRRLRNGDALATYRLNALDTRRMALGISIAAEVLLAAGATRVYPGLPGLDTVSASQDLEQLRERAVRPGHLKLTAFHPMGTVRMGCDPERSAVDSFGGHHVVRDLWVADASTFPTCVGVNPQMTIMAFALRTADRIAGKI